MNDWGERVNEHEWDEMSNWDDVSIERSVVEQMKLKCSLKPHLGRWPILQHHWEAWIPRHQLGWTRPRHQTESSETVDSIGTLLSICSHSFAFSEEDDVEKYQHVLHPQSTQHKAFVIESMWCTHNQQPTTNNQQPTTNNQQPVGSWPEELDGNQTICNCTSKIDKKKVLT